MLLIGAGTKSEQQPVNQQLGAPKNRGKPKAMTRQQQMMKQKALLDKARQVGNQKQNMQSLVIQTAGHSPR
jgi:hypothetical protein